MYCVKCGTKAEKGQKTCLACGMRLISPEALLKLLRKADLEKKLNQLEYAACVKPEIDESTKNAHKDKRSKDGQELNTLKKKKKADESVLSARKTAPEKLPVKKKESARAEEKQEKALIFKRESASSEKENKRVTPLFENPTQPKHRSIFDDLPEETPVKQEIKSGGGGGKPKTASKTADGAKKEKTQTAKTNPVVKLPQREKTISEKRKIDASDRRAANQRFLIPEREEVRRKNSLAAKKVSDRQTGPRAGAKRPDRSKQAHWGKAAPAKKPAPALKMPPARPRASAGGKRPSIKRDEENFVEKYLRSIISMMLLTTTVVLMLMWGYATDTGNRTMAELGLGSRKGYILLGDDCMADGNYKRAVEHYYKALSKRVNYEAGMKLAIAYRYTGEPEKETSALLLLMDRYVGMDEPYQRILELYPDPYTRPEKVQIAINMHER